MIEHKRKIPLLIILIVALIVTLSIFIRFTGISETFKYFLMYLVLLFVFFGASVWLNRKWISYIPAVLFAGATLFITVVLGISQGDAGFGRGLYVVLDIVCLFLSAISYLSAILVNRLLINEETFDLRSLFIDYKEYIALVIGLAIFLNNLSKIIRVRYGISYNVEGILVVSFIICSIFAVLIFAIYLISRKKLDLFKSSVIAFLLYLPISLFFNDINKAIVSMCVSFCLIIFQIVFIIKFQKNGVTDDESDTKEDTI